MLMSSTHPFLIMKKGERKTEIKTYLHYIFSSHLVVYSFMKGFIEISFAYSDEDAGDVYIEMTFCLHHLHQQEKESRLA